MSRKLNRKQMSPVKIRSNSEHRRNNLDADVQRIINHAAKLISKYNENCLEKVMDGNLNNNEKIEQLLRQSTISLPKIAYRKKAKKLRGSKKRKKSLSKDNFSESTKQNNLEDQADKEDSLKDSNACISRDQTLLKSDERKSSAENIDNSQRSSSKISLPKVRSLSSSSKSKPSVIFQEKMDESNNLRERELKFIYELEIKTTESTEEECSPNVMVQLTGESNSMPEPILLNKLCHYEAGLRPFQTGSLDRFTLNLKEYLGTISSVKVLLNTETENSSWLLDYICVKDLSSYQEYFFSCRRWVGFNSQDKLYQITLGYTPPFKTEQHALLSNSTPDNLDDREADESVHSNKTIKSVESSIEINDNRSHKTSSSSFSDSELQDPVIQDPVIQDPVIQDPVIQDLEIPDKPETSMSAAVYSESIHRAVETNDVVRVKELCSLFEELKDAPDENGCHPIHLAGRYYKNSHESQEIIRHLLSLGVDINQRSSMGLISLHYAIMNNNCPAVEFLIEHCMADPSITDTDGDTCLRMALKHGFHQIANYLERFNVKETVFCKIDDIIGETHDKENVDYLFNEEVPQLPDDSNNEEIIREPSVNSGYFEGVINETQEDNKHLTSESDHDGSSEISQDQNPIMVDNVYHETEADIGDEVILSSHETKELQHLDPSNDSSDSDKSKESQKSESKDVVNREISISGSENCQSCKNYSRAMNRDMEEQTDLRLLEEDQLDAENRGIMFHKTLSVNVSQKTPNEPEQAYQNTTNDKPKEHLQPTQLTKGEEDDTSSYSSKSKSTSQADSEDTMSTITPRSNLADSSSDDSPRRPSREKESLGTQKEKTAVSPSGMNSKDGESERTTKEEDVKKDNSEHVDAEFAGTDLNEKVVLPDNDNETGTHHILS